MKQTKKQWLILAAVMSVFSAVMPTSCKDDDNVSVVADNKPWTISADDNGDYVGTLDNFRLYALCLTATTTATTSAPSTTSASTRSA